MCDQMRRFSIGIEEGITNEGHIHITFSYIMMSTKSINLPASATIANHKNSLIYLGLIYLIISLKT